MHRLRHIDVDKRRNLLHQQNQFFIKFMSLNKSVKFQFHALLAQASRNYKFAKKSILPVNPYLGAPKNSNILFSNSN